MAIQLFLVASRIGLTSVAVRNRPEGAWSSATIAGRSAASATTPGSDTVPLPPKASAIATSRNFSMAPSLPELAASFTATTPIVSRPPQRENAIQRRIKSNRLWLRWISRSLPIAAGS